MSLKSPIAAVATPFSSLDALDPGALRAQLQLLNSWEVSAIVSGGTTGEFFSLTDQERRHLLESCRANFSGQVVAHISATAPGAARELLHHAQDLADAALILPPYYLGRCY